MPSLFLGISRIIKGVTHEGINIHERCRQQSNDVPFSRSSLYLLAFIYRTRHGLSNASSYGVVNPAPGI